MSTNNRFRLSFLDFLYAHMKGDLDFKKRFLYRKAESESIYWVKKGDVLNLSWSRKFVHNFSSYEDILTKFRKDISVVVRIVTISQEVAEMTTIYLKWILPLSECNWQYIPYSFFIHNLWNCFCTHDEWIYSTDKGQENNCHNIRICFTKLFCIFHTIFIFFNTL